MRGRMRGKETHVASHSLLWPTFHHVQKKNQIGKVPFLTFVKLLQNIKKAHKNKLVGWGCSQSSQKGFRFPSRPSGGIKGKRYGVGE